MSPWIMFEAVWAEFCQTSATSGDPMSRRQKAQNCQNAGNSFLSAQDRALSPETHTKRLEFDLGQIIEAREAPLSDLERIFRTLLQTFELCLSVVQI